MMTGSGGIPPPPPSVTLTITAPVLRKPVLKPGTTMKALFWARIQSNTAVPAPAPVIWDDIEDLEVPGSRLETLFSKVAVKVKAKENVEEKAEAKLNLAKIIDGKKSQNLGIFLKSKKLDVEIIVDVVMNCSNSLDLETLMALKEFQATPEELLLLKDHLQSKPEVALDLPDQFLWDLGQIHEVDARISCLIFQANFQGRCEEILFRVNNLKSCCQFLATNPNLKTVLGVILGKKCHTRGLTDFNFLLLLFSSLWKLLERWQPTERSSGWLRR